MRLTLIRWCAVGLALGCGMESDPEASPGSEGEATVSAEEECEQAVGASLECEYGFGAHYLTGDSDADVTVVELEASDAVVELEHAVFVPPTGTLQLVGDPMVANEACILGCFVAVPEGHGTCIVYDDIGDVDCISPAGDVETCEDFAKVCRG